MTDRITDDHGDELEHGQPDYPGQDRDVLAELDDQLLGTEDWPDKTEDTVPVGLLRAVRAALAPDPGAAPEVRAAYEDLIAEIGSMMSVQSWSKTETEARRGAYDDVLAVISDRLAALRDTAPAPCIPCGLWHEDGHPLDGSVGRDTAPALDVERLARAMEDVFPGWLDEAPGTAEAQAEMREYARRLSEAYGFLLDSANARLTAAPALDVERLTVAFHNIDHPAIPDCELGESSTDPGVKFCVWKVGRLIEEYERLEGASRDT